MNKIYIAYRYDIYDDYTSIVGIADSIEKADELIIEEITNVYSCGTTKFHIEEWTTNKRDGGGTTVKNYSKEDVTKISQEVRHCEVSD